MYIFVLWKNLQTNGEDTSVCLNVPGAAVEVHAMYSDGTVSGVRNETLHISALTFIGNLRVNMNLCQ